MQLKNVVKLRKQWNFAKQKIRCFGYENQWRRSALLALLSTTRLYSIKLHFSVSQRGGLGGIFQGGRKNILKYFSRLLKN